MIISEAARLIFGLRPEFTYHGMSIGTVTDYNVGLHNIDAPDVMPAGGMCTFVSQDGKTEYIATLNAYREAQ